MGLPPRRKDRAGKKRLELRLLPRHGGGPAALPFVERQWGLKVGFASLAVGLHSRGRQERRAAPGRHAGGQRPGAQPPAHRRRRRRPARTPPSTSPCASAPTLSSWPRRPASHSTALAFQPHLSFTTRPTRQLALKIPETRFAADDLFASLPAGLFTRLAGIRTSGELAFHLDFSIDLARPEALVLDVGLEKRDFRIRRFGRVNFRAVNAPFIYTAYEKDRAVRSFMVGPENPDFRTLDQIPPHLKNAVMISEDGAFFSHRGFLLEPFKNSIVANLRAGRFVRGASTISMQLVKNLYLKRQKTIARKLEEMLITWLIEENRLVCKERMLEIYLNIIEWGPGIYGAQEAARFYFAKDVADLTLAEAIFMASIIPRPKRFMDFFDEDQRLRPWLQRYYADVSAQDAGAGMDQPAGLRHAGRRGHARRARPGCCSRARRRSPPEPLDVEPIDIPDEDVAFVAELLSKQAKS